MASKAIVDIEAYFERIRYAGPRDASLDALHGITAAHVRQIPFENLDVLLGRSISLQPASIARKLIQERRGGYCFEHNTLLMHVLESLGFRVTPLSARVRVQRPRTDQAPRTHMFLRVEVEDCSWLTDVGIGGFSLTGALRLELDTPQTTPHELRRIVSEGAWSGLEQRAPEGRLFHQAHFAGAWHDLCDFTLEPMPEIDRVIGNWYTSAHPESHFKNRLMVARATADGRVTLSNRELGLRSNDGRYESRLLQSPEQLLSVLNQYFDLSFPADTRFACSGLDWP